MSILTGRGDRLTAVVDALGAQARVPRVNLLPPEIVAGRIFRRTQKWLAAVVLVVVLAIAAVYVLQAKDANRAADSLAVSQATGEVIKAEQAKYADVPRVYQAIDDTETARQSAMGQDVEWFRYMTDLSLTMPANVWLTSLDMSLAGGTPAAAAAPGAAAAAATGVGSMTFVGTAYDHPDVAAWLVALGKQKAVTDPYFSMSARAKIGTHDVVNFSSTAGVGPGALSHRFDRRAG